VQAHELVDVAVASDVVRPAPAAEEPVTRRRRRLDIGLCLALGWLALVVLLALLADVLPLRDPKALDPVAGRGGSPSLDHWLGTDQLGRDQLSRIAYGARVSLVVGIGSAGIASVIGSVLGLLAGYRRRLTGTLIMGWMDVLLSVPALILVIVLTSFLGAGISNVILAISILAVPAFARVARAQTLAYSERPFVKAARGLGATTRHILFRELAPNIAPTIGAYALVTAAVAIVVEASLSFLGLGVSTEIPTWGGMINAGRSLLGTAAHISLIPGAVLFCTVLALNAVGEKLQRRYGMQTGAAR
jgi:peptide/nickel transport system permease protein